MLKTINMVQGLLSSRRFRKDNGCSFSEKSLKLTPKMTKVPKFFPFFKVFTHFSSNFGDFVDWNVLRGQQGKRWLSSDHF